MAKGQKRTRRTPEQIIAELEARIASVKRRAETQKVRKNPAMRHLAGAIRSIDKALAATQDAATRAAVGEARTALAAVLTLNGVVVASGGGRGRAATWLEVPSRTQIASPGTSRTTPAAAPKTSRRRWGRPRRSCGPR